MFPVWIGFLAFLTAASLPGAVVGRRSEDIKSMNYFCDIGLRLDNCTDESVERIFHERLAPIHRNAIQFCCRQNKFRECDSSLEHRSLVCENEASKYDTCCIACGFDEEINSLHSKISRCCRCREFKSLQRPERAQKCRRGMFLNETSKVCEDIDECQIRNNGCFESQICVNTRGSFHCVPRQTCKHGFDFNDETLTCDRYVYHGPSIIIREVDSVEDSFPMESRNVSFSPQVACFPGFSFDASTRSCIDINECAQIKPICSHNCKNLHGSYLCLCPEGYKLGRDGKTCVDIDECLLSRTICGTNVCNNIYGSFICYPPMCPKGYKLYKHQRRNTFSKCSRQFCGDKNRECRKQPKYLTFKNVTMRITADSSREIVLHNIRKADYKVQVKLRLRVVDVETGNISVKSKQFELVQQPKRALLVLKQPFTTPDSLKLVVLVFTGSRNDTVIIEKITLNFFVI